MTKFSDVIKCPVQDKTVFYCNMLLGYDSETNNRTMLAAMQQILNSNNWTTTAGNGVLWAVHAEMSWTEQFEAMRTGVDMIIQAEEHARTRSRSVCVCVWVTVTVNRKVY